MSSIVASDLVAYHATTQSDADGISVGGAIDTLRRPDFTQLAANDTIEVVSSAAGDTSQTATATGRDSQGRLVTQTVTLNGVTAVPFNTLGTIERVLQIELSATAAGTVTVRRSDHSTVVRIIPVGERGFSMLHRKDTSSTTGSTTYYAKYFWKNTNGTNALLAAQVALSGDAAGVLSFGLETSVGGSNTATNRQTSPGTTTAFGTAAITLTTATGTADLASGSAIGIWSKMVLAQNNAAVKESFTSTLSGSTT